MLLRSVQRYKFESNSQLVYSKQSTTSVVAISTKIQIWKQFTTRFGRTTHRAELLRSVQRYKFESNSQQWIKQQQNDKSCCDQYKDTNLKAIHNSKSSMLFCASVVAISTKIQIWKQFTTLPLCYHYATKLLRSVQRYKFESNSQLRQLTPAASPSCCDQYKDTNLKAIHNTGWLRKWNPSVVAISTKIQIWKQFTTFNLSS